MRQLWNTYIILHYVSFRIFIFVENEWHLSNDLDMRHISDIGSQNVCKIIRMNTKMRWIFPFLQWRIFLWNHGWVNFLGWYIQLLHFLSFLSRLYITIQRDVTHIIQCRTVGPTESWQLLSNNVTSYILEKLIIFNIIHCLKRNWNVTNIHRSVIAVFRSTK